MRSTNCPAELAELLFALGIPEQVLAAFADGDVGVHAAAVHADDRLGQERRGQAHLGGDLAADQLVELDLVGGRDDFAVAVVDLKLRGATSGWSFSFWKPMARCTSAVVSMNVRSGSPGSE